MDFKSFMNAVEENLSLIKTEDELRNWIRNYARSIPEEERGSFLEQMQTRKPRSHKEILKELTDWCEKVEEGEIMLSSSGYDQLEQRLSTSGRDHFGWTRRESGFCERTLSSGR